MVKSDKSIYLIEQELQRFPPAVVNEFQKAIPLVEGELSEDDFYTWAEEGVAIAESGFRCWKATAEYFRVTPQVLEKLNFSQLINWARWGRMLSEESVDLALAYFRESPAALNFLSINQLEEWAKLGKSLYQGTRRSTSYAWRFFQVSPSLFRYLTLDETVQFINFADYLDKNWHEFASDCLNSAKEVLPLLEKQDCKRFLDLAMVFAETNWDDVRAYFTSGPRILYGIARSERARFLSLAEAISCRVCHQALPFLIDGSQALGQLPHSTHSRLLTLAEELLPLSCSAVTEFLKNCPTVLSRVSLSSLEPWFREGVQILQKSEEGGIAYFRTELNKSAKFLAQLSNGIELSSVRGILGMYCMALSGENIPILPARNLREKGIGWTSLEKTSTEGVAIFLPELTENYPTKEENFVWCKVVVTHQAGHLEFGSFDFCFEKEAGLFSNLRPQLTRQVNRQGTLPGLLRFFDLFSDRNLATDIFTIVEDSRVDFLVNHEYKGISKDYKNIQNDALSTRPPLTSLPLKELFLEVLIQISLGNSGEFLAPSELHAPLHLASLILGQVESPQATVEDSAEATIRLYQILYPIPNKFVPIDDWETIDLSEGLEKLPMPLAGDAVQSLAGLPDKEADAIPYTGPQEVEFRGDFKPELIQLLTKLKEGYREEPKGVSSPLSLEALKELAEKNDEIEIDELSAGEITSPQGLFVSDLKDAGQQSRFEMGQQKDRDRGDSDGQSLEDDDFLSFFYDEWDFNADDYKLKWCRVRQKTIDEGTVDFFETTLKDYAGLVAQIKRQFELLNPQTFRKVKGLPDGEEYDLDAVVDFIVQKKAGQPPSEKVYWRRNKTERDVSVVFLLDMSSSTFEYIDDRQKEFSDRYFVRDYKGYLEWTRTHEDKQGRPRAFKRIIDLEKEGTVILIKALETIGDTYAIYGFSGYGRENVEFYVVKDFEEEFSDKIKRRIDSISPMHSTRMGPAIRHATWKLEQQQAKSKFLFLISDGRPQDHGYGRVGLEKEYAINDTKMALLEAQWKSITPFCLTVDRVGHDYLKTMCSDMGYEVVADIESLPKRLPALYRKLTV